MNKPWRNWNLTKWLGLDENVPPGQLVREAPEPPTQIKPISPAEIDWSYQRLPHAYTPSRMQLGPPYGPPRRSVFDSYYPESRTFTSAPPAPGLPPMPPMRSPKTLSVDDLYNFTYGSYTPRFEQKLTPRRISPEPPLEFSRKTAIEMMFRGPEADRNPAAYIIDEMAIKQALKDGLGLADAQVTEILEEKINGVDQVFNKVCWYLARFLAKARAVNNQHKWGAIKLPDNIYKDIIREITSLDSPGFKKLEALLGTWSGKSQPPHQDELLFDPQQLDETWRRYEVAGRRLPRPGKTLAKQSGCPDPSASVLLATPPGLRGPNLSPMEKEHLEKEAAKREYERLRSMLSPYEGSSSRWPS